MVTVLEKDCFGALLNVHDFSWQAPAYSVDTLLPYHRMVSPPLPTPPPTPRFQGRVILGGSKKNLQNGGGGGGGEGS